MVTIIVSGKLPHFYIDINEVFQVHGGFRCGDKIIKIDEITCIDLCNTKYRPDIFFPNLKMICVSAKLANIEFIMKHDFIETLYIEGWKYYSIIIKQSDLHFLTKLKLNEIYFHYCEPEDAILPVYIKEQYYDCVGVKYCDGKKINVSNIYYEHYDPNLPHVAPHVSNLIIDFTATYIDIEYDGCPMCT